MPTPAAKESPITSKRRGGSSRAGGLTILGYRMLPTDAVVVEYVVVVLVVEVAM
jgi:hypothetical protein